MALPGVIDADTDLQTGRAFVTVTTERVQLSVFYQAGQVAGYQMYKRYLVAKIWRKNHGNRSGMRYGSRRENGRGDIGI
jgi:hypothetical protein